MPWNSTQAGGGGERTFCRHALFPRRAQDLFLCGHARQQEGGPSMFVPSSPPVRAGTEAVVVIIPRKPWLLAGWLMIIVPPVSCTPGITLGRVDEHGAKTRTD